MIRVTTAHPPAGKHGLAAWPGHFGMPFAIFAQINAPASGKRTR
jgi:hypothetical protein